MKRVCIILLSLFTIVPLWAQQQASFKITYRPQTKYTITRDAKMNLAMDTGAASGIPGQMTMHMTMKTVSDITTGASGNTQFFPLKLISRADEAKILVNGQDLPGSSNITPPAITLFGKYQTGEQFRIDSVSGIQVPDSIKNKMAPLVNAITNYLVFPSHPLQVGDSFTQDIPLILPAIPMGPTSGTPIRITYKLLSITGNMAVFDFTETINSDPIPDKSTKGKPINMTGKGTGSLTFDISKRFFSIMTNSLTLQYEMITGSSTIKFSGEYVSMDKAVSFPEVQ